MLINEQIRAQQVRLVGSQGEALGIVSLKEAMQKAEEEGFFDNMIQFFNDLMGSDNSEDTND